VPEVRELDLNPLLADTEGVIAVDARVAVAPLPTQIRTGSGHPRFAVRPYPKEWEREAILKNGQRVLIRPVRPEDEPLYKAFLAAVSELDLRLHFFSAPAASTEAFRARLTQIDYARAIAFVALDSRTGELMGEVRLHADTNYERGEFGILIRSDLKRQGLGWELIRLLTQWARLEGLQVIDGQVLRENKTMLALCRELGFTVSSDPANPDIQAVMYKLARQPGRGLKSP
jgi:acetyltransferase